MLSSQKPTLAAKPLVAFLGLYQLLGGLLGLFFLFKLIFSLQNPSYSTWLGIGLAALLYSFSVACGFGLLQAKKAAYTWSLVNQVLQVFSFGAAGLAYNYVAGVKLGLGVEFMDSWLFKVRLSLSSFGFTVGAGQGISFVTVNLLALVLIYLLEKTKEETFSATK